MPEHQHGGHRERLRNRFLSDGLDSFEEHEVLELLLTYCIPQKDTNPLGHTLIETFGDFSRVCDAPIEELEKINGLSHKSATFIKMIPQLSRLYFEEFGGNIKTLDSIDSMAKFLIPKYIGITKEVVYLVCMNNNNRVLDCQIIMDGIADATEINMRKIVELIIKTDATNVIISHNHPNASYLPSNDDIVTTKFIENMLNRINVKLIDHIIVSGNNYSSLRQLDYI